MEHMNLLLLTDVYKMGHMEFYPEGTKYIYSYLCCRSDKKYKSAVFFGLQYYLKKYLSQPITLEDAEEFIEYRTSILGTTPQSVKDKIYSLAELGYLPLSIKAVPEGSVVQNKNVLMTIVNTDPRFPWVVGFVESILLKIWNTMSVATYSLKLKNLCKDFLEQTADDLSMLPFQIHDFGYRGCSSEETSALSGASHLVNFLGTDTVPAVKLLKTYYGAKDPVGLSVPATEHSVMCSYTQANEEDGFQECIDRVGKGIVSIVSDSYNLWDALEYCLDIPEGLKVVFRPDSGDPVKIICGDESATDPRAKLGALRVLANKYGALKNSKGYKVLNPKVGLIYGDGMTYDRINIIFLKLKEMGYSTSNIVFGVGGLLLQQHNRDDLGVAIKATLAQINGQSINIIKDPITDHGKKSHTGMMYLVKAGNNYTTVDQCSKISETTGALQCVFLNGVLNNEISLDEIKKNIDSHG